MMEESKTEGFRKSPSHFDGRYSPSGPTILFITVCTQDREEVLAIEDVHQTILNAWKAADAWLVGRYVLMLDHIHFFASPASVDSADLKKWMAYWRSHATRNWPRPEEYPIWQRDYWDRALRRGQSYSEKWEYVRNNPVRGRLVSDPDDWPFQGELNELIWHD